MRTSPPTSWNRPTLRWRRHSSTDREYRPGRSPSATPRKPGQRLVFDAWPSNAAIVDFGIRSQEHYEALYYPVRQGEISPEQVDAAMGNGKQLTALVKAAPHNPHKEIEFRTDWDDLRPLSGQDGNGSQGQDASKPQLPSPSEISDNPRPESPDRGPVKTRGR